ncbi:MAG: hypothetical protein IPL36_03785 [Nigerium sp.]|nr:hypothetical protein [Nigerium sp.]
MLGESGGRGRARHGAGAAEDADARVAAKAAFALGRIGGSDAVAALTGVLGRGRGGEAGRRGWTLSGVLGADAVPALVRGARLAGAGGARGRRRHAQADRECRRCGGPWRWPPRTV